MRKAIQVGDRVQLKNGAVGTVIKPSAKQQSQEAQDAGHFMWDVKIEDNGSMPHGTKGQVVSVSQAVMRKKSIKQRRATVKRYKRKDFDDVTAVEQPPHEVALAHMYQTARSALDGMTPFDPQTGEENKLYKAMTEHCDTLKAMWGEYGAKGEDGEPQDLDEVVKDMETSGPGNAEIGEANLVDDGIIPEEVEAELGDEVEMELDDEVEMSTDDEVQMDDDSAVEMEEANDDDQDLDQLEKDFDEMVEMEADEDVEKSLQSHECPLCETELSSEDEDYVEENRQCPHCDGQLVGRELQKSEVGSEEWAAEEAAEPEHQEMDLSPEMDSVLEDDQAVQLKSEFDDDESPSEVIDDPDVDEILERYDTNKGWRTCKAGRARVRKVLAAGGRIKRGQDGRKWLVLPAVKKQVRRKSSTGPKSSYKVAQGSDGKWYVVESPNRTDTELGPFNSRQDAERELNEQFSTYEPKSAKSAPPKLLSKALPGETLSDFASRHGVDNIGGKWFVINEHRVKVSTPCDTLDQATQLIKSAKVRPNSTPAEKSVERSLFADLKKELGLLNQAKTRCGINGN